MLTPTPLHDSNAIDSLDFEGGDFKGVRVMLHYRLKQQGFLTMHGYYFHDTHFFFHTKHSNRP